MTTNTEHRRRETDRLGPYVQQVALDNANARIAELETVIRNQFQSLDHIFDGLLNQIGDSELRKDSYARGYLNAMLQEIKQIKYQLYDSITPPPAEKQGE